MPPITENISESKSADTSASSDSIAAIAQDAYKMGKREAAAGKGSTTASNDITDKYFVNFEIFDFSPKTDNRSEIGKAPDKMAVTNRTEVDRAKLRDYAEALGGARTFFPGAWGRETKREEMAWSRELHGRLKDLSEDEREALKGVYYEMYGTTLDADYAFLEGQEKADYESLMHRSGDAVGPRADRLMTLMDQSKKDYDSLSYVHTDRPNANRELRDTLKSMTEKEVQQTDEYFKRVYGKSLQQALNEEAPKTTQEMCSIYLKGSDKLAPEDHFKLAQLIAEESVRLDGSPNSNLGAADMQRLFERNFERLDWNEDGIVSHDEINRAMNDGDYVGEDAQLVAMLKEEGERIAMLSDDDLWLEWTGISKADMAKLNELSVTSDKTDGEKKLVADVDNRMWSMGRDLKNADKHLYGVHADPLDAIKPEAIYQNQVGDCYFLASVAALAKTQEGKEQIRDMIEDNKDGTYAVRFPGHPRSITIDEPTDAELAHAAGGTRDGVWVAVLEKAYAKYYERESGEKHTYNTDGIGGGDASEVIQLLSAKETRHVELTEVSKEEMHNILTRSMDFDRPVTCGIDSPDGEKSGAKKAANPAGLPSGHSYTIMNYDPNTRTVTIRNPWGSGEVKDGAGNTKDGNNDGIFTMSLDDFYANFDDVQYATGNHHRK
ncbi:MAG TPA: C2 family cysteine protease [Candidatus Obscuribacterales bacterium]